MGSRHQMLHNGCLAHQSFAADKSYDATRCYRAWTTVKMRCRDLISLNLLIVCRTDRQLSEVEIAD